MRNTINSAVRAYLRFSKRWLFKTPNRALDDAYEAALRIKAIEDTHFGGGKISSEYGTYGTSVRSYFQSELQKYLNIAKVRLAEFKVSSSILGLSTQPITEIQVDEQPIDESRINIIDQPALILKKLRLIDEVLARYGGDRSGANALVVMSDPSQVNGRQNSRSLTNRMTSQTNISNRSSAPASSEDMESLVDKTGVLPRSILRTVDRIKQDLDPNAEREVVENFRSSQNRTATSLRFVLLLVIIPLITQQIAKNFVVGPLVDRYRTTSGAEVFLNIDIEEEALDELHRYGERLRFQSLVGNAPPINEEQLNEKLKEKAEEIRQESLDASNDAVKNIFSDIFSALAFALLLLNSRRDVEVLKSFIDELVYGLSDSAKAFIIILLTDIFVGFHSPHGWEVLLEGVSRHFGIPESRDFIFLFIATFPVILDTIFKYWIFRYLNRISPSAVATYRNMNE